jgi:hypothetical protein
MSSAGAAGAAATNARAEASRRNGAKSRGPKTPEGKARASQNALKHGLRAGKHVVLPDEDAAAFAALEAALLEDLAPVGALQTVLARQIVSAAWRLARADRIEAEILIFRQRGEADLGLAVTRDGNTARAVPTLLRYRGAAQAEFLRSLRTLKALQAEAAKPARVRPNEPAVVLAFEPGGRRAGTAPGAPDPRAGDVGHAQPNEPEAKPGESKPAEPSAPERGASTNERARPASALAPLPAERTRQRADGRRGKDGARRVPGDHASSPARGHVNRSLTR